MAENDAGAGGSLLGGEPVGTEGVDAGTQGGSLLGGQPQPAGGESGAGAKVTPPGDAGAAGGDSKPQPAQSPEYERFNVPEGFDYNDGKVSEFTALAREMNLTQEQAQKLVDLHVRHWLGFEEQARAQAEEWSKQAMNDPEFGGQKFMQSLRDAQRFVSAFGGERLRAALDATGAGNHPEIFRAFARAGRILGEDRLVSGAGAAGARGGTFADLANTLYPNMGNGGNS